MLFFMYLVSKLTEAIEEARQKGMRVFGEPLIQFLTLDESEYFNKDWEHAARRCDVTSL